MKLALLPGAIALALAAPQSQDGTSAPPIAEVRLHRAMDAEGRWQQWERFAQVELERRTPWLDHLAAQEDWNTLEWIALYGSMENSGYAISRLAAGNAPNWLRAADWCTRRGDGHTVESIELEMLTRPGVTHAWMHAHPGVQEGYGGRLLQLYEESHPALDVGEYRSPWTPEEVFAALLDVGEVSVLEEGAPAEEGVRYRHQVLRAIEGYAGLRRHGTALDAALVRLLAHEDDELASAAALAFSHFQPDEVPWEELRRTLRDDSIEVSRREAALLGLSYAPRAIAYVELHEIVSNPDHPLWAAALSRLGDLGDAFTLEHLRPLSQTRLLPEHGRQLLNEMERIVERVVAREQSVERVLAHLQPTLEAAAWARVIQSPLASALSGRARAACESAAQSVEGRARVEQLKGAYVPGAEFAPGDRTDALRDEVRALAREGLGGFW